MISEVILPFSVSHRDLLSLDHAVLPDRRETLAFVNLKRNCQFCQFPGQKHVGKIRRKRDVKDPPRNVS